LWRDDDFIGLGADFLQLLPTVKIKQTQAVAPSNLECGFQFVELGKRRELVLKRPRSVLGISSLTLGFQLLKCRGLCGLPLGAAHLVRIFPFGR